MKLVVRKLSFMSDGEGGVLTKELVRRKSRVGESEEHRSLVPVDRL
jgi:hypothetical protein